MSRAQALELIADASVGALQIELMPSLDHPIRLVQGVLGTGKSLLGERWHRANLEHYRAEKQAPIPVYLEVRPEEGHLQNLVEEAARLLGDITRDGVRVVIDDRVNEKSASVSQILEEARYLAELWEQAFFLILSRPASELARQFEVVQIPPLGEQEAEQLIERLGGILRYDSSDVLRREIRRPLFAILFALESRRNPATAPRSFGELLNLLVHEVLKNARGEWSTLQRDLERLSVAILMRGGPVPASEVISPTALPQLIRSGLIFEEHGLVQFSLDILLEWFGSRSIQSKDVQIEQLNANPRLLERWFYALAMLVAEASHNDATALISVIVRLNPTLASRIVKEALQEEGSRALMEEDKTQPPPFEECGRRLRQTMSLWAEGLGPLAQLIAPLDREGNVLPIGVAVGRSTYVRSWYQGECSMPPVTSLPARLVETSPFALSNRDFPSHDWPELHWDKVGFASAWAWDATRAELSKGLSEILRRRDLPLDMAPLQNGPLWHEMIWASALMVMNYGSGRTTPISLDEIEKYIEQYYIDIDWVSSNSKGPFSIFFLRREVARLKVQGLQELKPLYPDCDDYSPNGWLRHPQTKVKTQPESYITVGSSWYDNFTDEGLASRVGAIYEAALTGYEQLVQAWFPALAPHLNTFALLPARLVGVVEHPCYRIGIWPSISWHLEPLAMGKKNEVLVSSWRPQHKNDVCPQADFGSLARLYQSMRPDQVHWLRVSQRSEGVSRKEMPATELAYEWLSKDLQWAGWI